MHIDKDKVRYHKGMVRMQTGDCLEGGEYPPSKCQEGVFFRHHKIPMLLAGDAATISSILQTDIPAGG